MWDVLLLSTWTEPVFVSPSYQLIRDELSARARVLAPQRLAGFMNRHSDRVSEYADMIPYQTHYPYCPGLLSVAGSLQEAGFSVRCVSLDVEKELRQSKEWLSESIADLTSQTRIAVGVSAVTPEINRALTVLGQVRQAKPALKTMIGGTHVTYCDAAAAVHPGVDVVVRGEGETTAVSLVQRWSQGAPAEDIDGTTIAKGSSVHRNPDRGLVDLTTLPMPAYELLDAQTRTRVHVTPTYSRGCPFHCNYCVESSFWNRRVRHKNAAAFVDELEVIAERLNWRYIHIADSTFGIDRAATAALCDELEARRIDAVFSINVRPDVFSYLGEELVRRLVALNFVEFYMGMETADEQLLKTLERRQDEERLKAALVKLKSLGVPFVKLYLVVGFPGDTHGGLQRTINRIRAFLEEGLIYYATGKYFVPAPGTIYSEEGAVSMNTVQWDRFERYQFPPIVEHEQLSPLELEQYLQLLQAVQLGYYRKLAPDPTEYARLSDWAQKHYLPRVYL